MASQKSKGPNGERGGRLMKAMMCEANRKEDRMCGKQTERRQPSGKGHNAQLSGSVWSGRRRQGFWGERATFLLPPQCHWALHGARESWNRRVFQLIAAGGLPMAIYSCVGAGPTHASGLTRSGPPGLPLLLHRGMPGHSPSTLGSPDGERQSDFPDNHSALTTYCPSCFSFLILTAYQVVIM